jgi:hypothetical protein
VICAGYAFMAKRGSAAVRRAEEREGRTDMKRSLGAGVLAASLLAATALAPQPAAAQDPVGGAIVGGALGAIVGGALGGGRGAAAGAIVGGTTGAVIAAEAQRRPHGYYWYRGGCYYRYPDGSWSQPLYPSYCGY